MDAMTTIMTRRSIRAYEAEPVSPELVETLLRAAMAAPSAGNQQPWRFVVIAERATLDRLAATSPYVGPLLRAPLAVVVCGDTVGERHPGRRHAEPTAGGPRPRPRGRLARLPP